MLVTIQLPPADNERQWSVNDFWSCILDNVRAVECRHPIFNSLAAIMWKMLVTISLPPPKNDRQRITNNFGLCILDNLRAMECLSAIFNLLAAFMGKIASNDIAAASYSAVLTEPQHFVWVLNQPHSNEVQCVVPELCLTQLVFAICCCIQHRKYASNVSQI